MRHREAIEAALFARVETVFGLQGSVTLYDLSNASPVSSCRCAPA
jgi:hypothetical protein